MKWLFRSFIFLAAFVLSVFAYAFTLPKGLSNCVVDIRYDQAYKYDPPDLAPRPTEIEVLYAGSKSDGSLRFVIVNGSDHELTYPTQFTRPHAILTANEKVMPQIPYCGNGMTTSYKISPGASAEVQVVAYEFLERPKRSNDVTVGFHLNSPLQAKSAVYTSEKFRLPEEFRTAMHPF